MTIAMRYSARLALLRFVLIAFVFGAVVPFFALYSGQVAKADSAALATLYGEEIFLCTERGFEWVKLADLESGKHTPKPDKHFECALCFVGAKGAKNTQLTPIELTLLPIHAGSALRQHFAETGQGVYNLAYAPSAPRAPPVVM